VTAQVGPSLDSAVGVVVVVLLSRVALILLAYLAHDSFIGPLPLTLDNIAGLFARWDSGWYDSIVMDGYSARQSPEQPGATNLAFYPVYPLLVRMVAALTGLSSTAAAFLTSNALFCGALLLLRLYALKIGASPRAAMLAVLFTAFVPQSFVFSAFYTESAYLFTTLLAMLMLREQRYVASGLVAGVLSAVRSNGVLFIFFALAHLIKRDGLLDTLRFWHKPERFIPIVLAPAGLFAYWWFCYWLTGDAFAQSSTITAGWGWRADWPWNNLRMFLFQPSNLHELFWITSSIFAFLLSFLLLKYKYYEEFIFCLACFTLYWTGSIPNSLLRYSIVLFPIYIALARYLEQKAYLGALTLGLFATVNGFLLTAWVTTKTITI